MKLKESEEAGDRRKGKAARKGGRTQAPDWAQNLCTNRDNKEQRRDGTTAANSALHSVRKKGAGAKGKLENAAAVRAEGSVTDECTQGVGIRPRERRQNGNTQWRVYYIETGGLT